MYRTMIEPWAWQERLGFVLPNDSSRQQWSISSACHATDGKGEQPLPAGDIRAHTVAALDHLEAVLHAAGLSLANVLRLTYYTTDLRALSANWDLITTRLGGTDSRPACTLIGVNRLACNLLVELEATVAA